MWCARPGSYSGEGMLVRLLVWAGVVWVCCGHKSFGVGVVWVLCYGLEGDMKKETMQRAIVSQLYKIATTDATALVKVDEEGNIRAAETDGLTSSQRAAVSYIKDGKGAPEVKPYDKLKAIELLGKHLGMWGGDTARDVEDLTEVREEVFGSKDD